MPDWKDEIIRRLSPLKLAPAREVEIAEELAQHLEDRFKELVSSGNAEDQARRIALEELREEDLLAKELRSVEQESAQDSPVIGEGGRRDFFSNPWQDIRYSLRQFRRSPAFTAVAVITLALGIGANAAIFSVVNAALLRPLPFPDSKQLVRLWDSYGSRGIAAPVSYPNFADWRAWNHSFSSMAAYTAGDSVLTGRGEPVHLEGTIGSASFFEVLGIQPILGRRFLSDEDSPHADNGADAVILSSKAWIEIFQRDQEVIGQTITLDGKPFVVVGVAPPGVETLLGNGQAQYWTTAAPMAEISPESPKPLSEERQISFLNVVGRIKPGLALAQVQADMDHVAKELERAYPKDAPQEGVTIQGLQESLTGNVRPLLLILLTAVGVVLLIACANVAALILARASGRQREVAIRAALGASRWRIARQLLTECVLLALTGGAAGLWLAIVAKNSLIKILGVSWLTKVPLDGWVLGFALLVTVTSSVIFGFAPMVRAAKPDLIESLKAGGHAAGESLRLQRFRQALTAGEVALAVALLSAAGLLAHSLVNLEGTDPGFDPTHVLTFPVSLPHQEYPQALWPSFFEELTARLRGIPGVVSASAAGVLPLGGGGSRAVLDNVAGRPVLRRGIVFVPVTPGYFQTMGIRVKAGRAFTDHDTAASEPVVILNETAVRQYFGNEPAVGQQVEPVMWDGSGGKTEMRTVIGVAADVKFDTLERPADPTIYWPLAQIPSSGGMRVAVRTGFNPLSIISEARDQLHAMDKSLPMFDVWSLDHYRDLTLIRPRYNTLLMASFAFLALVLTTVGIYGSIAYTVAQRTREIGIRMAMGADRSHVLRLVVGQGLKLALIGVVIGIISAVSATRFLSSLLYGVKPADPLTLVLVSVILTAVALVASFIPARRAAKVDPLIAVRYE
jgi:putative ABC transport system permease protein